MLGIGTTGPVLRVAAGLPSWGTDYTGTVTSVAQSFTGGLISVTGSPITTSGTLALTVAGTSGGIPYFSSASTWASSGALTQYGVVYGGGAAGAPVATAAGTTGQVLIGNTGAAPSWAALTSTAVSSINFGTTGLTPATATQGAVTVAGTLVVGNGGTGVATLSGLAYGNGTSAFTAATAAQVVAVISTTAVTNATNATNATNTAITDDTTTATTVYPTWVTTTTGNLPQKTASTKLSFVPSTGVLSVTGIASPAITNQLATTIRETATVSATAATGTINYDTLTQVVLYYTTSASGNFTINFRGSSGTSLDTVMSTGQSLSATFLVTNGATAYYNSAVTIDGNSVTPKWQGGSAPTSGNASSVDSYTYVIVKTGSATFTVLASQTKFA
jgi:hypothetical protein